MNPKHSQNLTLAQQRELLQLRCKLARLKLQAAQISHQTTRNPSPLLTQFADSAAGLLRRRSLLNLALLPARRLHRLLLVITLLALNFYENSRESQKQPEK